VLFTFGRKQMGPLPGHRGEARVARIMGSRGVAASIGAVAWVAVACNTLVGAPPPIALNPDAGSDATSNGPAGGASIDASGPPDAPASQTPRDASADASTDGSADDGADDGGDDGADASGDV
jgi:hypothetical protein